MASHQTTFIQQITLGGGKGGGGEGGFQDSRAIEILKFWIYTQDEKLQHGSVH